MSDRDGALTGIVFDVQRFCLHDGPGLRTTVFLKGCPLRCDWCDNPESQRSEPEIAVFSQGCVRCGEYDPPCPALRQIGGAEEDRVAPAATLGERLPHCPAGSVRWIGRRATAGSIMEEVRRDLPFYGEDGGLTLSGGEPLLQPAFARTLLRMATAEGISTAIETCGYVAWESLERCLPLVDTVLFDVKHVDPAVHLGHTGVRNELILDNLRQLVRFGANVVVRVPLIPGFNARLEDIQAIARFVAALGPSPGRMDLLPYHAFGRGKYEALGRAYRWASGPALSEQEVGILAEAARACGLSVTVGG